MLVNVRRAESADVDALVRFYDRVYRGGYSACFGKYGPIGPEDFWWVQSEKEVFLLEVDREPTGLLVISRDRNRLLVEEAIAVLDRIGTRRGAAGRTGGTAVPVPKPVLDRVYAAIQQRFKDARQDRLRLRTMERNPLGMGLARTFGFTVADALIVSALRPVTKVKVDPPEGYTVRRAAAGQDAPAIARLDQECLGGRVRPEELTRILGHAQVRAFVAWWETLPVGFVVATAKGRAAEWRLGVRDTHRRKGVGAALARAAIGALAGWGVDTVAGTHWAGDAAAEAFGSALGFTTERVYLYCEHPL